MAKCKCGVEFVRFNSMQSMCIQCALEKGRKNIKKENLIQAKVDRARKESAKTNTKWKNETQDIFNKMRRLEELFWFKERGIEPYCISCQKPLGGDQWCNGHFKTRAARPDLAFDRSNTFLQHNYKCNQQLSGDVVNYSLGLLYRFGCIQGKQIIDYCETYQPAIKRTPEDWKAMKKEFRARIKQMMAALE